MKEDNQINIPPEIDEETKRIEEILGIASVEDDKKSDFIYTLKLKDVIIDDFSKFLPYLGSLRTLYLSDCTITNFSELLKLGRCIYFYLDNVTFKNSECNIIKDFPYEIRFSNMNFDAGCLNGFQASGPKKGHKLLEIKNCHIENIQELNNIAGLSRLVLDKITFTYHSKKIKQKSIRRIDISDSQFEDVSFIPFKKSVRDIDFTNCQIGSIAGLSDFKKLKEIGIDTNTTVEDTREQEDCFNKEITCSFFVNTEGTINLKNVLSLKNDIKHLYFIDFKGKTIDNIGKFENVSRLSFYESKFYVDAFLPIAKQIKRVDVNESVIKNHNYFTHFLNLTSFELSSFEKKNIKLQNFLKLLPLKDQLKELNFYESQKIPLTYSIEQFTALKTLKIGGEISVKTAESILTLKKLKKLSIRIEKTKRTFDVGRLKNLEFLIFNSNAHYTGFEHLKRLKSLRIGGEKKFDINTLPKMKSLKRLNFSSYDCKIDGLSRFPNLEFLKLKGVKKLKLKTLRKLKVLDLENSEIKDFSSFEMLPSLEKLDLSSIQNTINLKGMSKFPNLKWLSLLESEEVDDISGLESLKKLERLDLLSTKVTDVRVLNSLPNLKEANLAVRDYYKLNLEAQLNHPEIVISCGLPMINLRIWKEDKFRI